MMLSIVQINYPKMAKYQIATQNQILKSNLFFYISRKNAQQRLQCYRENMSYTPLEIVFQEHG